MSDQERGVLYPSRLPEFHRFAAEPAFAHAIRWLWIPEWDLAEGARSRQEVLPFPACNLTIERSGVTLVGPPTQRSFRTLEGSGWCVGALLRPAAAHAFVREHAAASSLCELRDRMVDLEEPLLLQEVTAMMSDEDRPKHSRRALAAQTLSEYITARVAKPKPGSEAAIANELESWLGNAAVIRADQLPDLMHVSARTLQRIAERYFGVSLHAMIRRRRLQESAERLRHEPELSIADLATSLGYADHAHLSRDFKSFLGMTPSEYRGFRHL